MERLTEQVHQKEDEVSVLQSVVDSTLAQVSAGGAEGSSQANQIREIVSLKRQVQLQFLLY